MSQKKNYSPEILNRKAKYNYHITENLETGMVLTGTEVKAIRLGKINIAEAWVDITPKMEMFLVGAHIEEYSHGNRFNHEAVRRRKLLAHRSEIIKFNKGKVLNGLTIVPLKLYFTPKGYAKLLIGLGKGKDKGDKRQDVISRESKREMGRAMKGMNR